MAATVIIVIFNVPPDAFQNINPVDQQHEKIMHLFYPPLTSAAPPYYLTDFGAGTVENPELLSVDVMLHYDGTLAEGTPVTVTAVGYLYPEGENALGVYNSPLGPAPKTVVIGFDGATFYNDSSIQGSFPLTLTDMPSLYEMNQSMLDQLPKSKMVFSWDTQGNYYPYLEIPIINQSIVTPTYSYDNIYVSSSDVTQQQRNAKITIVLTIVLFVFTFITSFDLLWKLRPDLISRFFGIEENSKKTENTSSTNPQQSTPKNTTNPNNPKDNNPGKKKKH